MRQRDLLDQARLLLQRLGRERDDVAEARVAVERFAEGYPGVEIHLLVDQPPGSPWVDYDLLVSDGPAGTVALSWRADGGVPWSVRHTEHWAASFVVGVNGRYLTVQDALRALQYRTVARSDLLDELVDELLIAQALEEDPVPVGDEEIQRTADAFRRAHGLHSVVVFERWRQEVGLSEDAFIGWMRRMFERSKLSRRVAAPDVEAHFARHAKAYDTVVLARAETPDRALAQELFEDAAADGLARVVERRLAAGDAPSVRVVVERLYVDQLPEAWRSTGPGQLVAPDEGPRGYAVAEFYVRTGAVLDRETRNRVEARLFRSWLDERRATAVITWHWA
jgi:putative peptide maturation system protein